MVLYRKYRPQNINQLDIKPVRERLYRVLSSAYRPHAFLFTGPKGTGKTSAARIVAKILNCERKKSNVKDQISKIDIEPCNSCDSCISITSGGHIDVLEIDAASNRGIDEIRQLREGIKFAPVSASKKVYIIDEVHMLTKEAFNALLKTLEEPPVHAVFILATTELQKLPDTIKSRLSKFDFRIASKEEIVRSLQRVADGEKLEVDTSALEIIADSADGSFRDATKLLEQAISENALISDKLLTLLGRDSVSVSKFLKMLQEGKDKNLLSEIEKMADSGVDFKLFVKEILNILHTTLLVQHGVGDKEESELTCIFNQREVLRLIKLFSKVYLNIGSSHLPQLPLEMGIIEWQEREKK